MKKKMLVMPLIMGAGLALSVSTSANAQFFNMNLPWTSWNGFYFGAYFGAGSGSADQTFHDRTKFTQSVFIDNEIEFADVENEKGSGKLSGDITGSKADLFVGYNFNPPCANFVLGAQLEGTFFSDIAIKTTGRRKSLEHEVFGDVDDGTLDVGTSIETDDATTDSVDELRSMFSLVARAGYLVAPPLLVYVLGGATEGHFVIPDTDDPLGSRRNKWEPGYTYGAGIEYKFTENWFLRAEYRRLHFNIDRNNGGSGRFTSSADDGGLNIFTNNFSRNASTDFDFNLGQIGIVYRF
jgi:opacity protein-like surface antigen